MYSQTNKKKHQCLNNIPAIYLTSILSSKINRNMCPQIVHCAICIPKKYQNIASSSIPTINIYRDVD